MNPLLILVVTISAGAFFGMAGMILAAPLTSAAIHISRDLSRVRAAGESRPSSRPSPLLPSPRRRGGPRHPDRVTTGDPAARDARLS